MCKGQIALRFKVSDTCLPHAYTYTLGLGVFLIT